MELALFDPGPEDHVAIDALARFCGRRGPAPFEARELLALAAVRQNLLVRSRLERWLGSEGETLVLGEVVLHRVPGGWECEVTTPGSPYYLSLRILPQARVLFTEAQLLPVNHAGFIGMVYRLRRDLLDGKSLVVSGAFVAPPPPAELLDFVAEHLHRCGLSGLRPDVRSISEICDIFDEYEFRALRP